MRFAQAARSFRERLVADVALSPLAHAWARKVAPPDLAARCGLDPSVLDEAAKLLTQVAPSVTPRLRSYFSFSLPAQLNRALDAMAERMRWTRADLVRSLMHTVMQCDREPVKRPFRKWVPALPESDEFREALTPKRARRKRSSSPDGAKVRPDREYLSFLARPGLHKAIRVRATAYGAPTGRYMALWLSDLVDGLLADLVLDLVSAEQTFEKVEDYWHPVLRTGP